MGMLELLGLAALALAIQVQLTVSVFNCGSSCGDCPDNWSSRNGYCYRFFSGQITPSDAQVACAALGANLVSIGDSGEECFVRGLYVHQNPAPVQANSYLFLLTGMLLPRNAAGGISSCSYTDGTSCSTYKSQDPTQPGFVMASGSGQWCPANKIYPGSDAEPKISTIANCGAWVFNSNTGGCWLTMPCSSSGTTASTSGYVCKFARPGVTQVPPSNMTCSQTGYYASNGKCYNAYYDDTITSYSGAQASCAAVGGNLASILCDAEQTLIEGLLGWKFPNSWTFPGSYVSYIGLKMVRDQSSGVITGCSYQDGSLVSYANPLGTGFMKGDKPYCDGSQSGVSFPKDPRDGAADNCTYILKNTVIPGGWISDADGRHSNNVNGGNFKAGIICKMSAGCPSGTSSPDGNICV